MLSRVQTIIFTIVLTSFLYPATAQTGAAKYPSAVLVQLKAERNRTNYLIRNKHYNELETFKKDVSGVMMATIADFRDHFSYCPVYYYIDTNFEQVMAGNFKGILLDDQLAPAKSDAIPPASTDFFIVYYGAPAWQTKKGKWDTTRSSHEGGRPAGQGLIINDHKFRQIYYISRVDFDFFNYKKKGVKNPYKYTSKKFNLSYTPVAAEFNRQLLVDTDRFNYRHP